MLMTAFLITSLILVLLCSAIILKLRSQRQKNTLAFFHLYYSSGGGGERVLWHTISALLKKYPHYRIIIYSHNKIFEDKYETLRRVRDIFKIDLINDEHLIDKINFVPLLSSAWIEARRYPFLTLLLQSLGSILVAFEAAYKFVPDIYFETIGFTFTLPIFKLLNCKVITYVHYPTISNDMIENVRTSIHPSFNNRAIFVRNRLLRYIKLLYYRLLANAYGFAGRRANLVMVNSRWTQNHIKSLWKLRDVHVVYPPCDVDSFKSLPTPIEEDESQVKKPSDNCLNIISIAQFRPEKNHQLQIESFDMFLSTTGAFQSQLTLYGGCRDEDDRKRVSCLQELIQTLGLVSNVRIAVNVPFDKLVAGMRHADVAVHSMRNEHFGIVLVECMAAGLIVVAHNSGGPQSDIIDHRENGFLANDLQEFTSALVEINNMTGDQRQKLRNSAIKKAEKFSNHVFEREFIKLSDPFLSQPSRAIRRE